MPTSMAAALMLILLQNPFAAASISLQLSFAAISGIIWAAPAIQKLFPKATKKHRLAKLLLYSVTVSVGVAVCSAPLSAYYFNILWLISPLSNLLCLWAAGIVFAFGLVSVLAGFLWLPLGMAFHRQRISTNTPRAPPTMWLTIFMTSSPRLYRGS